MAEETSGTQPQPSPRVRRSSFAGQTFADLFGTNRPRPSVDTGNNSPPNQQYTGPISQAAAQAQRRRMSLTTLGLSGSPEGTGSRLNAFRGRQDSISSANSGSIDESAIEDEPAPRDPTSTPVTPFARRMSFGARALRDVRNSSSGGQSGGGTGQNGSADFWNENMRNRAQRTSIAGQADTAMPSPPRSAHARAVSVATMEAPIREMPKEPQRPDHFQERILKGDFYMD
ncbi:hypothetical protein B0A55_06738 [Friedmanniomyces simplex]|uniref:Uncharacterized protein n=1 Tax=Friedmanniomyces simplex TaxID=329884 RepID=A0A4V5NFA5_9PEZI|nr:hypothetical protein B0A55_06738 [Friedmanniomyces simplex]